MGTRTLAKVKAAPPKYVADPRVAAAEKKAAAAAAAEKRAAEEIARATPIAEREKARAVAAEDRAAKAEAAIEHAERHARNSEERARETKKATDDEVTKRVAAQIEKARAEIRREAYLEADPGIRERLTDWDAEEARMRTEYERHTRILAAGGPRALEKQLDAQLMAAIEEAEQA